MRIVLIGIGILCICIVYFLIDPVKHHLPDCPFYSLTDLYCPGCGSQRGLHALLHGNLSAAFGYNPLLVFGILYFIAEAGIWMMQKKFNNLRALSARRYTPLIVLVIVIVFWILRNIPFAPFSGLAPG